MNTTAAGRIFASHYQILVTDDPRRALPDEGIWDNEAVKRGYTGDARCRVFGTEADLNDHWVEVVVCDGSPAFAVWDRVTCFGFRSETGFLHVLSVIDDAPRITVEVVPGEYAVYAATNNLGKDPVAAVEGEALSDEELSRRKDVEWYKLFVVPGCPEVEGRVKDSSS
jgi:hypothetical protein